MLPIRVLVVTLAHMTATRIILAGVLGGIAMFFWSFIAHDILPLGETGISELTNEQAVVAAMQTGTGNKTGLYRFPGFGLGENPTKEQKQEAMNQMTEKFANNPSGILIYNPPGARSISFLRLLGVEFAAEVLEVILAVLLLSKTSITSFGGRVGFFFVAGLLVAITTNISYWNWDGFPANYTAAYMTIQVVGFLCAGVVVALVLPKTASPA